MTLEVPGGLDGRRRPSAHVSLAREDEAEPVRFTVTPRARREAGRVHRQGRRRRRAPSASRTATRWWSIRTRGGGTSSTPAEATLKIVDVAIAPRPQRRLRDGRRRPGAAGHRAARRARHAASTPTTLAFGDLSTFDAIVTGVRAYERRAGPAREQPPPARLRAAAAARSSSSTTSSSSTRRSTGRSRRRSARTA